MQCKKTKRSSNAVLLAGIKATNLNPSTLKNFLCDLANCRDERLDWLRGKHGAILKGRYSTIHQMANYRDELRVLWRPLPPGVPDKDFQEFEEWRKIRPKAEPGEMICNRWLACSETGLLATWDRHRRELVPIPSDLPAFLAYGCLLFGNRLCYCRNPRCPAPWFIGTREDQQYCSTDCAWPAKKAAKLKWWRENRASKLPMPPKVTR